MVLGIGGTHSWETEAGGSLSSKPAWSTAKTTERNPISKNQPNKQTNEKLLDGNIIKKSINISQYTFGFEVSME